MLNIDAWITNVSAENGLDPEDVRRKIRDQETRKQNRGKQRQENDGKKSTRQS